MKSREDYPAFIRFFIKKKQHNDISAPVSEPQNQNQVQVAAPAQVSEPPTEPEPKTRKEKFDVFQNISDTPKTGFSFFKRNKKTQQPEIIEEEIINPVDVMQQIDGSLGKKIGLQFCLVLLLIGGALSTHIFVVQPVKQNEDREARKVRVLEKEQNNNRNTIKDQQVKLNNIRQVGAQRVSDIKQRQQEQAFIKTLQRLAPEYRVQTTQPISVYRDNTVGSNPENVFGNVGVIYRVNAEFTADFFDYLQLRDQLFSEDVNFQIISEEIIANNVNDSQTIKLDVRTIELQ